MAFGRKRKPAIIPFTITKYIKDQKIIVRHIKFAPYRFFFSYFCLDAKVSKKSSPIDAYPMHVVTFSGLGAQIGRTHGTTFIARMIRAP